MFFIGSDILQSPLQPPLKWGFAHLAIGDGAHAAGAGRHTTIGVDEHFQRVREMLPDEFVECIYFRMCLIYIEIPRHGEVTIEVEDRAVFDGAEVVQVYPSRAFILVEHGDELLEQFHIGLVHDTGHRLADDFGTLHDDENGEQNGDRAIYPRDASEPQQQQPGDDAQRRPSVGLEVFAAGFEGERKMFFPGAEAPGTEQVIGCGGDADKQNPGLKLLHRMCVKEVCNGFIHNDKTRHQNQNALERGRNKFYFSVAVRMVFVARSGSHPQAVQPGEPGHDIHRAFERVGEHGNGIGQVVGEHFQGKK